MEAAEQPSVLLSPTSAADRAELRRLWSTGQSRGEILSAERCNAGCLRVLHELGIDLADPDLHGNTLATYATVVGDTGCLKILHELGIDLTTADSKGLTMAVHAASHGQENSLRTLHSLGVDVTVGADSASLTPAMHAALSGHTGCLRMLHGLGVNLIMGGPRVGLGSPLHMATGTTYTATSGGLRFLLSVDAIRAKLNDVGVGDTPLRLACVLRYALIAPCFAQRV
jgi:ankyrin repeat protein